MMLVKFCLVYGVEFFFFSCTLYFYVMLLTLILIASFYVYNQALMDWYVWNPIMSPEVVVEGKRIRKMTQCMVALVWPRSWIGVPHLLSPHVLLVYMVDCWPLFITPLLVYVCPLNINTDSYLSGHSDLAYKLEGRSSNPTSLQDDIDQVSFLIHDLIISFSFMISLKLHWSK